MTTNKPSAGAVRAAKVLLHLQSPPITNDQAIRLAAEIIDRESGLAELLEAAKELVADGECYCADNVASRELCGWCKASVAIAKASNRNSTVQQVDPAGRWTEKGIA